MKLGQHTIDTLTGTKITPITLYVLSPDGTNRRICVQPRGINKDTGLPLANYWVTDERLKGGPVEGELPAHLIGERCEDDSTGLKGTVTAVCLHINGCVHADIIPDTKPKNGEVPAEINLDIRRLKGKAFVKYTEAQLAKSTRDFPSPARMAALRPNK